MFLGLSYGAEGGGSNLVAGPVGSSSFAVGPSRFGSPTERADLDAALYWSLQNLGVTNLALIKSARANLGSANLELVRRLNDVRAEVAIAHARIHARLARIGVCEEAVGKITTGYSLDLKRIYGGVGLPIELLIEHAPARSGPPGVSRRDHGLQPGADRVVRCPRSAARRYPGAGPCRA